MSDSDRQTLPSALALGQGLYFALTGLWGLLHYSSFQRVTGPKTDVWLVKTVSVLVAAIGGALAWAGIARRITPEVAFLGATSAAGLMAIDCYYVVRRRISPIYLADALAEAGIVAGWAKLSRAVRVGEGSNIQPCSQNEIGTSRGSLAP